jgi:hypothetical protein
MYFINFAEMAGLVGEGFARQEITSSTNNGTTTTTIYGGKPSRQDPNPATDALEVWKIQKTVIVDDGTSTNITVTWAEGSWTNRASLTYKYL